MRALLFAVAVAAASPALAQHEGHGAPEAADPHAGHKMPTEQPKEGAVGTDLEPGSSPAPSAPADHYADRFWAPDSMARSRATLRAEHGDQSFSQLMVNMAEVQPEDGHDAYRFDAEAWIGGDIDRLMVKAEGEGAFGDAMESLEAQALYSRAIDAYWNLQAGVRHDFRPDPSRTYAVVGVEGLAPYWFEVEGALFLSNKGDVLGRIEASYDQRITQRLILQPRAELNFAAQDVPELGIGSGLSDAELGVRLRYEIVREFAPYVGVSWERKIGDSARFARIEGEERESAGLVLGVRWWF